MIDIDLVKLHLRLEADDDTEEVYLQHLIDSAVDAFCVFSNRTLVASNATLPDPVGNTLKITKTIEQGALLLIGHWYESREAVITGTISTELDLTTTRLWAPYRWAHF
jgi:hypothetical protein